MQLPVLSKKGSTKGSRKKRNLNHSKSMLNRHETDHWHHDKAGTYDVPNV